MGNELNFQTAFVQATKALDQAGALASNREDTETLTNVAALYIELGARLMQPLVGHPDDDDEDEEDDFPEKQALGFAPQPADDIIPQEEELDESVGSTSKNAPSKVRSRVQGKSREL
jgi:hypothetical protein